MFRSILVPLDGTPMAHQAVVPAGDIARRLDASLAVALVGSAEGERREAEASYLQELRLRAASAFQVPVEAVLLEGSPAHALAALAENRRVDLLVSSTRGRGALGRALRGGVALRLAHAVPCPALLLKPLAAGASTPDPDGFSRIMVPLDGSVAAETAIESALALAAERRVVLVLVRVVAPFELGGPRLPERRRVAGRYLNAIAERFDRRGVRVECRVVTGRSPGAATAALAERRGVDLLALTTRERGEGARLLLGSVADTVVRLAAAPVLVCHAAVRATAAAPIRAARAWPPGPRPPVPVPA